MLCALCAATDHTLAPSFGLQHAGLLLATYYQGRVRQEAGGDFERPMRARCLGAQ